MAPVPYGPCVGGIDAPLSIPFRATLTLPLDNHPDQYPDSITIRLNWDSKTTSMLSRSVSVYLSLWEYDTSGSRDGEGVEPRRWDWSLLGGFFAAGGFSSSMEGNESNRGHVAVATGLSAAIPRKGMGLLPLAPL